MCPCCHCSKPRNTPATLKFVASNRDSRVNSDIRIGERCTQELDAIQDRGFQKSRHIPSQFIHAIGLNPRIRYLLIVHMSGSVTAALSGVNFVWIYNGRAFRRFAHGAAGLAFSFIIFEFSKNIPPKDDGHLRSERHRTHCYVLL